VTDSLVGGAGIVVIDVNEVEENRGAVNMAEKIVAETLALGGALDETRNVGD